MPGMELMPPFLFFYYFESVLNLQKEVENILLKDLRVSC